jgi:pimeloyl-ACP methyl ester carboxylesterase
MEIEVNGTRLWFDVDGAALVPDGDAMVARPSVLLVHGGPGTYDHSYFKPHFGALARSAQVIYVDLRDHGRSARHRASDWSFELCADDLAAFCAALDIARPVVLGHSMGGFVALLLAARHPDRVAGLLLQSTMARFDLDRLIAGFRRVAGDEVAALAERDYAGEPVSDAEWDRVFRAFGPVVPDAEALARRIRNLEVAVHGMELMRRLDLRGELARVACPVLVSVGDLDPVTPVAAAREIAAGLAPGTGRLDVLERAGHFPWLDRAEAYWPLVLDFIASLG